MYYVKAKRRRELEELYRYFSGMEIEPTELGRKQFFELETYGKRLKPKNSVFTENGETDPYCLCLEQGKKWFSVLQEEYRRIYLTEEWMGGFYLVWKDWVGHRWMLKYLFSWCKSCPDWLFKENDPCGIGF